jgi:acyl-CoA reductase-like NAD-dependent aldehyde dehydrogenase
VKSWIDEAVDSGATLLCGGERKGPWVNATWLEKVSRELSLSCREVFGPVAILEPYTDFKSVIARVNDSDFGLQAGVFTKNLDRAHYAFEHCEVGGVVIGDIPSLRVDAMPYGGVKDSGEGREGLRFAMEEMSDTRIMLMRGVGRL